MSQFEFLVMTEKNVFAYKLFLSLNISDFNLFFTWKLHTPLPSPPSEKSHPSLPQQLPLKVEVLSNPTFLNIWLEVQPSPAERGWGCTLWYFREGGRTLYGGSWHFMGGLDNPLETMLYYLILISLWVAIYTIPITFKTILYDFKNSGYVVLLERS